MIKGLDQEQTFNHLGVNEGDRIRHASIKEKLDKEYIRKVKSILKTKVKDKKQYLPLTLLQFQSSVTVLIE